MEGASHLPNFCPSSGGPFPLDGNPPSAPSSVPILQGASFLSPPGHPFSAPPNSGGPFPVFSMQPASLSSGSVSALPSPLGSGGSGVVLSNFPPQHLDQLAPTASAGAGAESVPFFALHSASPCVLPFPYQAGTLAQPSVETSVSGGWCFQGVPLLLPPQQTQPVQQTQPIQQSHLVQQTHLVQQSQQPLQPALLGGNEAPSVCPLSATRLSPSVLAFGGTASNELLRVNTETAPEVRPRPSLKKSRRQSTSSSTSRKSGGSEGQTGQSSHRRFFGRKIPPPSSVSLVEEGGFGEGEMLAYSEEQSASASVEECPLLESTRLVPPSDGEAPHPSAGASPRSRGFSQTMEGTLTLSNQGGAAGTSASSVSGHSGDAPLRRSSRQPVPSWRLVERQASFQQLSPRNTFAEAEKSFSRSAVFASEEGCEAESDAALAERLPLHIYQCDFSSSPSFLEDEVQSARRASGRKKELRWTPPGLEESASTARIKKRISAQLLKKSGAAFFVTLQQFSSSCTGSSPLSLQHSPLERLLRVLHRKRASAPVSPTSAVADGGASLLAQAQEAYRLVRRLESLRKKYTSALWLHQALRLSVGLRVGGGPCRKESSEEREGETDLGGQTVRAKLPWSGGLQPRDLSLFLRVRSAQQTSLALSAKDLSNERSNERQITQSRSLARPPRRTDSSAAAESAKRRLQQIQMRANLLRMKKFQMKKDFAVSDSKCSSNRLAEASEWKLLKETIPPTPSAFAPLDDEAKTTPRLVDFVAPDQEAAPLLSPTFSESPVCMSSLPYCMSIDEQRGGSREGGADGEFEALSREEMLMEHLTRRGEVQALDAQEVLLLEFLREQKIREIRLGSMLGTAPPPPYSCSASTPFFHSASAKAEAASTVPSQSNCVWKSEGGGNCQSMGEVRTLSDIPNTEHLQPLPARQPLSSCNLGLECRTNLANCSTSVFERNFQTKAFAPSPMLPMASALSRTFPHVGETALVDSATSSPSLVKAESASTQGLCTPNGSDPASDGALRKGASTQETSGSGGGGGGGGGGGSPRRKLSRAGRRRLAEGGSRSCQSSSVSAETREMQLTAAQGLRTPGIYFNSSDCTWNVQWKTEENKRRRKAFSCTRHGMEEARQLALNFRNALNPSLYERQKREQQRLKQTQQQISIGKVASRVCQESTQDSLSAIRGVEMGSACPILPLSTSNATLAGGVAEDSSSPPAPLPSSHSAQPLLVLPPHQPGPPHVASSAHPPLWLSTTHSGGTTGGPTSLIANPSTVSTAPASAPHLPPPGPQPAIFLPGPPTAPAWNHHSHQSHHHPGLSLAVPQTQAFLTTAPTQTQPASLAMALPPPSPQRSLSHSVGLANAASSSVAVLNAPHQSESLACSASNMEGQVAFALAGATDAPSAMALHSAPPSEILSSSSAVPWSLGRSVLRESAL